MAKTITIDWSLVKRGPRGLCPATAFIQSAEIAEALSRSDLVEPFARLAVFAATDLRFVAAGEAGAVRFDATLLLFNWFRLRNRDAEAAALIRAARTDTELAAEDPLVAEMAEDAAYAPYLARQDAELRDLRASEALELGAQFPFGEVPGLSNEMVERLEAAKPANLAAAGRVPGITPAALSALLVHARRRQKAA